MTRLDPGPPAAQRLFLRLEEDLVQGPESGTPAAATLRAYAVRPALRPYVAHILAYRESFAPGEEVVERVLPDGALRLVLHFGDAPADAGSGGAPQLVGPSTTPTLLRLRGRMDGLSVTLRPGAAAALFGLPAGELAGAAVALDMLGRRAGLPRLAALAERSDDAARVDLLQAALLQAATLTMPAGRALAVQAQRLLAADGARAGVAEVAAALGLGERRLQQLFYTHVGLSPRAWGRLARMHHCLRALRRQPGAAWAALAAEGGFYDQPHLVREFRALCGCTPGEFVRERLAGSSKTGG